ncbi:MAG: hypothetical protein K2J77_09490 [Oscillospiraceae bacterium]|nr:hypothetical protein [Oscillospiraceae bacterium]
MENFETHHDFDPLARVVSSVHELLYIKNEVRGSTIFVPEWNMTIAPQVEQCDDRIAVLGFRLYDEDFDEPLYECCASTGKDTDSAIGSCVGSFLFAFMNGIIQMKNGENGKPLQSTFGGKSHTWQSYNSDLVGMGESVDGDEKAVATKYWDMLKSEIVKRLGNQKMCYVKIFASKAIGKNDSQVTGEVRVNDVPSAELSDLVYKHAEGWNVQQFASQKQFFFIKQDGEVENPYSGESGRAALREKVKTAIELFIKVDSEEMFDALPDNIAAAIGDDTLAQECFAFMPEVCAEHAFQGARFAETVQFSIGGSEAITVYRNQLADFYPIGHAMLSLFSSGVFGEQTNDIYKGLIGFSATYRGIAQVLEKGGSHESCAVAPLHFNVNGNFVIR